MGEEREAQEGDLCVRAADSCCCTAETDTKYWLLKAGYFLSLHFCCCQGIDIIPPEERLGGKFLFEDKVCLCVLGYILITSEETLSSSQQPSLSVLLGPLRIHAAEVLWI